MSIFIQCVSLLSMQEVDHHHLRYHHCWITGESKLSSIVEVSILGYEQPHKRFEHDIFRV